MSEESSTPQETVGDFCCIQRYPSDDQLHAALQAAIEENPSNGTHAGGPFTSATPDAILGEVPKPGHALPSSLVANVSKYWAAGRTLKVKFLSGNETLRAKVRKYAETWTYYANINFEWLADDAPDKSHIRVDFERGDGHYSYLGTDNLGIPQNMKTMNLDATRATDVEIRRVALHEFGHAIGCEHEHQSPMATFVWNEKVVYEDLGGPPNNWPKEVVDHNVLNRLKAHDVTATDFDATSIMCYSFPREWFMPGTGSATNNNTQLSKRDKEFIGTVYPPNYGDVGTFNTMQVRAWDAQGTGRDSSTIGFTPVYPEPPRLAVGLSWLDIDAGSDLSVAAAAEEVVRDNFTMAITSKPSTRLYSAGASWLEVAAKETDILVGQVDFASAGTKTVTFESRFDSNDPPTVVAFLTAFELGKDSPWSIKAAATEASPFKFKLSLEASQGVDLRGATVAWVAFPEGKEGMSGGAFSTDDVPGLENAGAVDFGGVGFHRAPQIFTAISGFSFEAGRNLRLRLSTGLATTAGFAWGFDSWYDSVMQSASAAYIALSPAKADKDEQ